MNNKILSFQMDDTVLRNNQKTQILEDIASRTKFSVEELSSLVQKMESNILEENTIIKRLHWLLNANENMAGNINLIKEYPDIDLEMLEFMIENPIDAVIDIIVQKSSYFSDKRPQLETLFNNINDTSNLKAISNYSTERILKEMKWWLVDIALPQHYFETSPLKAIGEHIVANRGSEIESDINHDGSLNLNLRSQIPGGTFYICSESNSSLVEAEIQNLIQNGDCIVSSYRAARTSEGNYPNIVVYIVMNKKDSDVSSIDSNMTGSIESEANKRYQDIHKKAQSETSMVIDFSDCREPNEIQITTGYSGSNKQVFSRINSVLRKHGLTIARKYNRTHAEGGEKTNINSLYVNKSDFNKVNKEELRRDITALGLLPNNAIGDMFDDGVGVHEVNFINAATSFIHQFVTRARSEITYMDSLATSEDMQKVIKDLQRSLDIGEFQDEIIADVFIKYPAVRQLLFNMFDAKFNPNRHNDDSYKEAFMKEVENNRELTIVEKTIFKFALKFVENIARTSAYLLDKSGIAYRMNGDFLSKELGFDASPYGWFFIVGDNFSGFHTRFQDIARGGIRIVVSRSREEFNDNLDGAYREGYGLASTQELKNKDIAEGGSKGIIILDYGNPREAGALAFRKYVDSVLDIILPENKKYIENYKEEILFLGPDEGSADLMDWACERAHDRGYKYWKGITTGKGAHLGGISHIDYGMTTTSVHEYVLQLLNKLGINEADITKVQTGGPDGDLGSNEILMSKDKTTLIIDGGGVIYDPNGLDRTELSRLAIDRIDSSNFDPSKIGEGGFKVNVDDRDITLSDGTKVKDGAEFRNNIIFNQKITADLFVPCGGRPNTIDIKNWEKLLDAKGTPRFKYIIEGANLYITPEARIKLEGKNVIIFKDSSTNKGGVNSSSLEVLAGLALSDQDFIANMTQKDNEDAPKFRKEYIKDILEIIKHNARLEFEALWLAHQTSSKSYTQLSDILSKKINRVNALIVASDLFEDMELRRAVLSSYVPKPLMDKIGMDEFMDNVPLNYQKAIFSKHIASRFVYATDLFGDDLRSLDDAKSLFE